MHTPKRFTSPLARGRCRIVPSTATNGRPAIGPATGSRFLAAQTEARVKTFRHSETVRCFLARENPAGSGADCQPKRNHEHACEGLHGTPNPSPRPGFIEAGEKADKRLKGRIAELCMTVGHQLGMY